MSFPKNGRATKREKALILFVLRYQISPPKTARKKRPQKDKKIVYFIFVIHDKLQNFYPVIKFFYKKNSDIAVKYQIKNLKT